jgi:hypothetical protein
MDSGKSKFCSFFEWSNMCFDSLTSVRHKYELSLGGHQMSKSVKIIKLAIFYQIGTCPYLLFLKT